MKANASTLACEETMMLWAVRSADPRRFVHVGMLEMPENGAACACLCRGCGEALLAVNVNKDATHFQRRGAQRKHFKHRHTSAADSRCLRKIAQLLALQIFVEQQVVYLPGRERPTSRRLPNEVPLMVNLRSAPERVRVTSCTWVDDLSAVLVLDEDRELMVTVRTVQTMDVENGSRCVLSLAGIDDPAIASWSKEQILEHLRAPNNGLEWARHWEDPARDAMVEDALAREMALLLGEVPPEWLVGLSGMQFSETILHFLIKKAVAERGSIQVPAYRVSVEREMPDGEWLNETATWPSCTLVLEDVRLERRLGNMVPDVMCRARPSNAPHLSFDLMIEGAVTHLVDQAKKRKIMQSGMACIEIVAGRFDLVGKVPAAEIEELVCSQTSSKQWIFLPMAHKAADKRLDALAAETRRRRLDEKRTREREERQRQDQELKEAHETETVARWIGESTDAQLVKGYVRILESLWAGDSLYRRGYKAEQYRSVVEALRQRNITDEDPATLESSSGVLRKLVQAHRGPWDAMGDQSLLAFSNAVKERVFSNSAVDLMDALAHRQAEMSVLQRQVYAECCAIVRREVEAQNPRFQRDGKRLRLYALVVPPAAEKDADFGSPQHYARMKNERETQARRVALRARRSASLEAGRIKQSKWAEKQAIAQAIQHAAAALCWQEFPFEPPTAMVLHLRYGQNRPAGMRFVDLNAQELFQIAEGRFRSSASVETTLCALPFTTAADVPMAAAALVHAGLCARVAP